MKTRLLGILAVALCFGCVEKEPQGEKKKIDPAFIERNILAEAPAMKNAVNADLGGKVVYLGNDLNKSTIRPGETFVITHYWRVAEPPGSSWRIFSHVLGASSADWMNVDYTDMRAGHGPDKWKAGQIIRDEQTIQLKKDWKSPYAQVTVGLFRKGSQTGDGRMPVVSGPHDKESRVLAAKLTVSVTTPRAERYVVRRAPEPITIDGKADEAAWASAAKSPAFSWTEGGKPMNQATHARLLWDDDYLYAFIEAADTDVFSEFDKQDDSLWKADVVELFIDADRNRSGYVELQVNPNNAHLDAWFATTRAGKTDFEWNAEMKSAVNVRGTADNRADKDQGWDVEVAIPLAAVKGRDAAMRVNVPPQVGDVWKLNVVRVDKAKGAKQITASSWSPITIQDFHALDRLLEVVFGDAEGKIAVAPPAPAAAETAPVMPKAVTAPPAESK